MTDMADYLANIPVLSACSSTHVWAADRVGQDNPLVVVRALTQYAGHGRKQRTWIDDGGLGGCLLLTLALAPQHSRGMHHPLRGIRRRSGARNDPPTGRPVAPAMLEGLSVRAAHAVADALHAQGAARLRVKEPNDLVDRSGAKVAGFLVDTTISGQEVTRLVLSIGLNVRWSPADLDRPTASLADHGPVPDIDELASLVARALWHSVYPSE